MLSPVLVMANYYIFCLEAGEIPLENSKYLVDENIEVFLQENIDFIDESCYCFLKENTYMQLTKK